MPLSFVVLGARLDLRGLFSNAELLAFAAVLVALNALVHVLAARLLRMPRDAGLVTFAQLGVPSAIVALGLPLHVLTPPQAAAIVVAALASIAVCSIGAVGMPGRLSDSRRQEPRTLPTAASPQEGRLKAMARVHQSDPDIQAGEEFAPLDSGYLTDGRALFHVERTLLDNPHGELLIELEDCATLELIVCSAKSVAELGMRPVKPVALTPA